MRTTLSSNDQSTRQRSLNYTTDTADWCIRRRSESCGIEVQRKRFYRIYFIKCGKRRAASSRREDRWRGD